MDIFKFNFNNLYFFNIFLYILFHYVFIEFPNLQSYGRIYFIDHNHFHHNLQVCSNANEIRFFYSSVLCLKNIENKENYLLLLFYCLYK